VPYTAAEAEAVAADRGNSSWKYFSCVHAHAGVGMTFPDELSPATDGKCAPRPILVYTHTHIYLRRGGVRVCVSPAAVLPRASVIFLPDFFSEYYRLNL